MLNIAEKVTQGVRTRYFGAAEVVGASEKEGILQVRLTEYKCNIEVLARIAVSLIHTLGEGDEVLVAGDDINKLYIIGVLTNKVQPVKECRRINICDGAYSEIDNSSKTPVLQVFSKRKELLIEYDPGSEKTRINIEAGDLEFTTQSGDIVFDSSQNIQLTGQMIEMKSHAGIRLGVIDSIGKYISTFILHSQRMRLSSSKVDITAQQGEFKLKEARYAGERFVGKIKESRFIAGKLSIVAKSITKKAKNIYQTVEQLHQLKTGRMRTLVESTFHLKSKKSYMKSEEDFKIKSNKIHLG